jgi:hypothetical protein
MKHKIKLINWAYTDNYGVDIEIDGDRLFYDAEMTYNCIESILQKLGIDYEIEYVEEREEKKRITRLMKLVPVENDNEKN